MTTQYRFLAGLSALLLALLASAAQPLAAPAQVTLFSPQGETRQVRQVTARFGAPMVALGDPRGADPFEINCAAKGTGRWADGRNWVYDFDEDLPAGLDCRFMLRADLKTLAGGLLTGQKDFGFDTGGPAVRATLPGLYDQVDEEQVFVLKPDAVATSDSVRQHARCAIEGVGEEVPVEVLEGAARREILQLRRKLGYQYFRLVFKDGYISDVGLRNKALDEGEPQLVALRCMRRLPAGGTVTLLWGKGIAAASGIATRNEQRFPFRVREAFTAQAECTRSNARSGCLPMQPIELRFTAMVPRAQALAVRIKLADGRQLKPTIEEQAPAVNHLSFNGPFPELQPATIILPARLVDDAGRTLANADRFPLEMRVDEAPPLAKFSAAFGILEANEGGVLPVTLRNVEPEVSARVQDMPGKVLRVNADPTAIAAWMRRVDRAEEQRSHVEKVDPAEQAAEAAKPKLGTREEDEEEGSAPGERWVNDTGAVSLFDADAPVRTLSITKPAGAKDFEVVGIPLKDKGFYVVELASQRLGQSLLGRDQPRYVSTAALVTDMAVHFKHGREGSLVWVTRLHDGSPVADAAVHVANSCTGTALWDGRTDKDGIARIAATLGDWSPYRYWGSDCRSGSQYPPLMVSAIAGDDFSFALSSWDEGIQPSQFGLGYASESASQLVHTVFDRTLFRAGETVSMKHYARRHRTDGFAPLEGMVGKQQMIISHQGSDQSYTIPIEFSAGGTADSRWQIPAEARLGTYAVMIVAGDRRYSSGTFRVEEFRLPSMRASVSGPATQPVNPRSLDLDLHVAYLSGGGAGGLAVKLRTQLAWEPLNFHDYPDYVFSGLPVTEGLVNNTEADNSDEEGSPSQAAPPMPARTIPISLDATGTARINLPGLPHLTQPARLTAELEYSDANGELLSSVGHVTLLPSNLAVGIRREGWAGSTSQLRFRVVVLDAAGKPQAKRAVKTTLYLAEHYAYRKRLIGGFYAYESGTDTRKLAPRCDGITDERGLLTCELAPGAAGEVLIRAEAVDDAGNIAGATASAHVYTEEDFWFGSTSGDRMDLLPEKPAYEAGEKARLQVRMPFRQATALVTVERQGVIDGFVTQLDGRQPMIELPVMPNYAPNVFVSVLAVRGRVPRPDVDPKKGTEPISALIDLNKPAFRLGIAGIRVGWKPHRLDVTVGTDKPAYKVRDKAVVRVHVSRADGGTLPAGTEVALSAIDAALLELAPNTSWDLLKAMMGERGLEVQTATAQMQVVGKRHYGRKAVPAGGGGGRDNARELFDTLLLWNGHVVLDAQGNAQVTVPLNDSLTDFRIVAVASGGVGHFGTGEATIRSTQDLMLLSGLPPLVREGDDFLATFTVRNTSQRTMGFDITGTKAGLTSQALAPQHFELPAGQARNVAWRVAAPFGGSALRWDLQVKENGGTATDHLRVAQQLVTAVPVRTYQATLQQLAGPLAMPAALPAGAIPGRGGLELTLQAHLGGDLAGVREFFAYYSYDCIEQQLSRAIGLGDQAAWQRAARKLPAYLDAQGLVRYFPTDLLQGDDALTAYILQVADESGWELPAGPRQRMLGALQGFVQGRIVRYSALPTSDLTIRKLAAIEALSRHDSATPAMLDSLAIDPTLLPTSALLDYAGILRRLEGVRQSGPRLAATLQQLRARLNFQGTTMGFSTERSDTLWWLMVSGDSNANRMLLTVLDQSDWSEDLGRLVRGALGRQQRGHWNTTVANAWGVLAMARMAERLEKDPVQGRTTASFGATTRTLDWEKAEGPQALSLPWASTPGSLQVAHAGSGKPWLMVRATAALPLKAPLSTGFTVHRTLAAVEQRQPGKWSRGDVVRVHLDLQAQSDMSWVVVDDPIPAGATILGSGLGGQSQLAVQGEKQAGWAWPAFEERRFEGYRGFFRFVPKGNWSVEYTVRLNNPGVFQLPTTRVEAMYAPEMFSELPNAAFTVEP
jgi:uncharacterized protein YfaS (alpha-2-macroglobulin family)